MSSDMGRFVLSADEAAEEKLSATFSDFSVSISGWFMCGYCPHVSHDGPCLALAGFQVYGPVYGTFVDAACGCER